MTNKYNDYELLYLISEGSEEAEEILYNKYSFLIYKRIHAFKIQKRYREDFFQEGLMCLNTAINSYCDLYNKTFNKFFDMILQRRFIYLLKRDYEYFYFVTLFENDSCLNKHLEEHSDFYYEEENKKKRLVEEVNEIIKSGAKLRTKIKALCQKGIKPREIASILSCDIKKVYNEIYAIKNNAKKRIDKKHKKW